MSPLIRFATGFGVLLVFMFTGGLWVSLVYAIPQGAARTVVTFAAGAAFAGLFLWMIIGRLYRLFADDSGAWREVGFSLLYVLLLLGTFAAIYSQLGIIDNTSKDSPTVHNYWTCLYYSFVTFTTLGYGDFYPVQPARPIAATQAFVGYLVLGLLASTSATLVQRAGQSRRQGND